MAIQVSVNWDSRAHILSNVQGLDAVKQNTIQIQIQGTNKTYTVRLDDDNQYRVQRNGIKGFFAKLGIGGHLSRALARKLNSSSGQENNITSRRESIASPISQHISKEFKYTIPDDGACQFRACLTLKTKNSHWIGASKMEILEELTRQGFDKNINDAIKNSITYLRDTLGMNPSERFGDFFSSDKACDAIYNKTIGSGGFNLYSPIGIGSVFDGQESLSDDESKFLDLLADNIGHSINESLSIPTSKHNSESGAYAVHTNGNHYNLVAPVGYLR